jgi:hypothetical protein
MCPRVDFIRSGYRNATRRRGEITPHLLVLERAISGQVMREREHVCAAGLVVEGDPKPTTVPGHDSCHMAKQSVTVALPPPVRF